MIDINTNLTGNEKPYAGCGLDRMFFSEVLKANVWFARQGENYSVSISGNNARIEKQLKSHIGRVTTKNLHKKMSQARKFLEDISKEYACPVCGAGFSSSVTHIASHAVRGSQDDHDFSTSWETPNGASGINYWKFDKSVSKKLQSLICGAVADHRAEHLDQPARGRSTIVSVLFGRA